LTNHPRCDTIRVSRGSEVPPHRLGKAKKKNVKNLLTNHLKYDTIRVSRGEGHRVYHRNQTPHLAGKSGGRSH
jgi:hypothetical protein